MLEPPHFRNWGGQSPPGLKPGRLKWVRSTVYKGTTVSDNIIIILYLTVELSDSETYDCHVDVHLLESAYYY